MPAWNIGYPAFRGQFRQGNQVFRPSAPVRRDSRIYSPALPRIEFYTFRSGWALFTLSDLFIFRRHGGTPADAAGINSPDTAAGTEEPV